MAEQIQGKITQIIGAVLDIKFPEGKLPKDLRRDPYRSSGRRCADGRSCTALR